MAELEGQMGMSLIVNLVWQIYIKDKFLTLIEYIGFMTRQSSKSEICMRSI